MEYNQSLLHDPVPKALTRFAIPLLLANLLQILYSSVDMWIVGHFASTADVSAVSTASMLTFVITITIAGFATGLTVTVGQFAGAQRHRDISRVMGAAIFLFAVIAVAVTLPLLIFCRPIVGLLNAPAGAVDQTFSYLFICSCGVVFIVGYNVLTGLLRGLGDSRAPLLCVAVSSVINIIADYVLVKILGMGAAGAALATVGSQAVSFLTALIYLMAKRPVRLYREDVRPSGAFIRQITKIGAPIALQEFLVNLSFVLITRVINAFGMEASAAGGIAEKIINIAVMPTVAFSASVSTLAAQNIGAKQPKRARQGMWTGICICLVLTTVFAVYSFFRGETLISIFSKDAQVVEQGRRYLKFYAFDQMMLSFVFIMNGYFNACGHSVFTMVHSLITTFGLRVPMTILLGRMPWATMMHIGIPAPVSSFVSIVICVVFLARLRKKEPDGPRFPDSTPENNI